MTKRIIVGVIAVAMVFSVFGTFAVSTNAQAVSGSAAVTTQFNRNLTIGSTGADVAALQTILVSGGYLVMPAGVNMGYFGPLTRTAVAKWQAAVGISPAAGYFGPISRAKLNASVVANPVNPCPAGYTASGMSPVICTPGGSTGTSSGTSTNSNGPLKGGEASLEEYRLTDGDASDLEEGDEDAEVAEFEFDVEDGDVRVERVELMFTGAGNEEDEPWNVFESAKLWLDGKEVADMDVDSEDDWSEEADDEYRLRFSSLNEVVREGSTAEFTLSLTVQGSVDGSDGTDSWEVWIEDEGIRAIDSEGIDHYTGEDADFANFNIEEAGEDEELTVRESSDNPSGTTLQIDEDSTSDWYTVLKFETESEESDIEITEIPVTVSVTGGASTTTVATVLSDARLMFNGQTFDDYAVVASSTASSSIYTFDLDDEDVVVEADGTEEFELQLEFRASDDNYNEGIKVSADLTSRNVDAIEAEGADDLGTDQLNGSVDGEDMTLRVAGIDVNVTDGQDSSDATVDENSDTTNTDDQGEYILRFEVTGFEEDQFVELSAFNGTVENDTGVNYLVENTDNSAIASTTGTSTAGLRHVSGGDREGSFVRIGDNDTAVFELSVSFDPTTTGRYRIQLYSVNYNDQSGAQADTQQLLTPEEDYESDDVEVEN